MAPPRSRHASSRPQGFHVPSPGRRMSQDPGFDRLTRSVPGDATNGVTIEAIATGEPDKSCTVMDHPFRSLQGRSLSLPNELSQLRGTLVSVGNDLINKQTYNTLKKTYNNDLVKRALKSKVLIDLSKD